MLIATPMIKPPKTSHNAVDWNPENTTEGGDTLNNMAMRKNNKAVRCSGNRAVANNPIMMMASPADLPC